ncbi:hypothetical protein J2X69_004469 [Algoriphagus sp. 4150]|nr:hypothetical protein [Algoriphagus sp. 4150]
MELVTVKMGCGWGIVDSSSDFARANMRVLVSFDSKNQSGTEHCQDWFVEPQKWSKQVGGHKEQIIEANY